MVGNIENDMKNEWIGDSGATHHISNPLLGMYNLKKCNDKVRIPDGTNVGVEWLGDIDILIENKSKNEEVKVKLKNVSYIPNFWCNLFSITLAIKKGMQI